MTQPHQILIPTFQFNFCKYKRREFYSMEQDPAGKNDIIRAFPGKAFDICLDSRHFEYMEHLPLAQDLSMKRPVGRPKKQGQVQLSLAQVVSEEPLNHLMRWMFDDQNIKVSPIYHMKKKTNTLNALESHETRIKVRRQKGYKKNMACPLLHLLTKNPIGHTTRVLTEEVLGIMESKISQESQEKMRRRIYEFLMVMRTTGLVYSEEEKRPPLSASMIRMVQEYYPDYFTDIPEYYALTQQAVKLENPFMEEQVPQGGKKYNKKKALNIREFLSTSSLRSKHLSWFREKINSKRQLVKELSKFITAMKASEIVKIKDLNLISVSDSQKEQFHEIKLAVPYSDSQSSLIFAFALVPDNLLNRGDLLLSLKPPSPNHSTGHYIPEKVSQQNFKMEEQLPEEHKVRCNSEFPYKK